jgi:S1-C subfamily serine protease
MSDAFDPYHRWLGISPKHQPPDHYRLLGLEQFEADLDVICDAAERQSRHVRSYQLGSHASLSQKILNEIAAAKACLCDPATKAAYDQSLRQSLTPRGTDPAHQPSTPSIPSARPEAMSEGVQFERLSKAVQIERRYAPIRPIRLSRPALPAGLWLLAGIAAVGVLSLVMILRRGGSSSSVREFEGRDAKAATSTSAPQAAILPPPPPIEESNSRGRIEQIAEPANPSARAGSTLSLVPASLSKITRFRSALVRVHGSATASGFVIRDDADRWLAVANYHAVGAPEHFRIAFINGKLAQVQGYVAADPSRDLIVLEIAAESEIAAVLLSDLADRPPVEGAKVVALGATSGRLHQPFEPCWEAGEVCGLRAASDPSAGDEPGDDEPWWVATTARVTHVTSGGPLVDPDRGAVVGINMWRDTCPAGMSFAVSALEIRRLIAGATKCRPLATLPKETPIAGSGQRRPSNVDQVDGLEDFTVDRAFANNVFTDWQNVSPSVATLRYPGGSLFAVSRHSQGRLDGPTLAFYEDQRPMTYAIYCDGERHGIVMTWNEKGERVFWGQYQQGKRHGLFCLFKHDQLCLVERCAHDNLQEVYLPLGNQRFRVFDDPEQAQSDAAAGPLMGELALVELSMKPNERQFKKLIHEEWESDQRRKVAEVNPQRRAEIQQRINQRTEERISHIQALRRWCGWP